MRNAYDNSDGEQEPSVRESPTAFGRRKHDCGQDREADGERERIAALPEEAADVVVLRALSDTGHDDDRDQEGDEDHDIRRLTHMMARRKKNPTAASHGTQVSAGTGVSRRAEGPDHLPDPGEAHPKHASQNFRRVEVRPVFPGR